MTALKQDSGVLPTIHYFFLLSRSQRDDFPVEIPNLVLQVESQRLQKADFPAYTFLLLSPALKLVIPTQRKEPQDIVLGHFNANCIKDAQVAD